MNIERSNFGAFCRQLEFRLKDDLPGESAHLQMASRLRLNELNMDYDTTAAVKSAVLVLFYPADNEVRLSFILRPDYNGVHAGQVSFPGGRVEEKDHDLIETALREAQEEVNINPEDVTVIGTLTDLYIPPSNYLVTPVVGYSHRKPDFVKDPAEVSRIIETDIGFLFDPDRRKEKVINVRGFEIEAPYFDVDGYIVWGATAMILSELKSVIESIN